MFQIYLEPIQWALEQIEKQQRLVAQDAELVDSAIRTLQNRQGFESVLPRMRNARSKVEEERVQLQQMAKSLGNVLLTYRNHENRILDYGEDSIALNHNMMVGMVQMNSSVISGWNIKLF